MELRVVAHQEWDVEAGHRVLSSLPADDRLILPALQRIQSVFGHVPDESISLIAAELNVSRAEVVGVLTFYHDLRTSPPASRDLRICLAEACRSVGAADLAKELGDGGVAYAVVYCLGNCALGPAAQLDGRLLARCDSDALRKALA